MLMMECDFISASFSFFREWGMSERFQRFLFVYLRKKHLEMFLPIVNILLGQNQIQGDVKFVKLKISGSGKWQVAV